MIDSDIISDVVVGVISFVSGFTASIATGGVGSDAGVKVVARPLHLYLGLHGRYCTQ